MQIVNWLKSPQGEDVQLVLSVATTFLLFLWMLKNHKIIKKWEHLDFLKKEKKKLVIVMV